MKHYDFRITYTSGNTFTKRIDAQGTFRAWEVFSKWITGFVYDGNTDDDGNPSTIETVEVVEVAF